MSNYDDEDIIGWFSLQGGKHIPLHRGESKQAAIKAALSKEKASKSKEDNREKQIKRNKEQADKLNAEQAYQNSLKMGNKTDIKDGQLYFKGEPVEKLDPSWADPESSLFPYVNKDGSLTAERLAVHQQLIQEYFDSSGAKPYPPGAEKWAYFTGGGGASGKGQFSADTEKFYGTNTKMVVIDPDRIKGMLAKADLGSSKLDKISTAYYHTESSALAKQLYAIALKHNYPVMYDGTATKVKDALAKIDRAESCGYKTHMNFISTDYKTVLSNTMHRYLATNRLVPIEHQFGAHQKAYDAVQGQYNKYDKFTIWDNSGRQMAKMATSTKGGDLNIVDKQRWDKFKESPTDFTLTKDKVDSFNASVHTIDKRKEQR